MDKINIPTLGEILLEEFIIPLNMSLDVLAQELNMLLIYLYFIIMYDNPLDEINGKCLAKYFGLNLNYFLDIQKNLKTFNKKNINN